MDIIKISMLGVGGVLLSFLLKSARPEYASFLSLGIGLVILGLAVGKLSYLFETMDQIRNTLPLDGSCMAALVKMIGVTYIGQFSSGICRDAGYQAMGAQIELFCRLSVMALSMPVLLALMETIQGFLS
ncbi:MAG: stage III sporulation AC/AD family protein [Eubacteriales bacterium]|nr:stage III sporulation AC/AD family protein [Eubacteriales bacterium]